MLAQFNTATPGYGYSPYIVPAGQSLVVTDLDFDLFTANGDVGILISNGPNEPTSFSQHYQRFDFTPAVGSTTTQHISLASGMVFPPGSSVGVEVTGSVAEITANLRGYLTPQ